MLRTARPWYAIALTMAMALFGIMVMTQAIANAGQVTGAGGQVASEIPTSIDLLVTSYNNNSVLRYDGNNGNFISTFVPSNSGGLAGPQGLTYGPDGNLYVSSSFSDAIKRYNGSTGSFMGDFVPQGSGGLSGPTDLVFGPDGNLYVNAINTSSVMKYNGISGAFMGVFVTQGSGGLSGPTGMTFGPDGNLYVSGLNSARVLRYNGTTGAFIDAFVTQGSGGLSAPNDLVFGPDANLYVVSRNTQSVLKYNGTTGAFLGAFVTSGSGGINGPIGIQFGPDGNFYVASRETNNVLKYNGTTGAFLGAFVPTGSGGLNGPFYLPFHNFTLPQSTPTATQRVTQTPPPMPTGTPNPCGVCNVRVEDVYIACNVDGTVQWVAIVRNSSTCNVLTPWVSNLEVRRQNGPFQIARSQTGKVSLPPGITVVRGDFCFPFPPDVRAMRVEFTMQGVGDGGNADGTCRPSQTSHQMQPCAVQAPCGVPSPVPTYANSGPPIK